MESAAEWECVRVATQYVCVCVCVCNCCSNLLLLCVVSSIGSSCSCAQLRATLSLKKRARESGLHALSRTQRHRFNSRLDTDSTQTTRSCLHSIALSLYLTHTATLSRAEFWVPEMRERERNETKRHDETIATTVDGDSSVRWALLTTKAIPERAVKASSKKNKRNSPSAFIHIIFHLLFRYISKFDSVLILSSWLLIFFLLIDLSIIEFAIGVCILLFFFHSRDLQRANNNNNNKNRQKYEKITTK